MAKPSDTQASKLNLRMKPDLRARLERDAEKRDLSLNAAIIGRLEDSFAPAPSLEGLLEQRYGRQGTALLLVIGEELRSRIASARVPGGIKADWMNSPQAIANVAEAIARALKVLGPVDVAAADLAGEWGWLVAIADPSGYGGRRHFGRLFRDLLGPAVTARVVKRYFGGVLGWPQSAWPADAGAASATAADQPPQPSGSADV